MCSRYRARTDARDRGLLSKALFHGLHDCDCCSRRRILLRRMVSLYNCRGELRRCGHQLSRAPRELHEKVHAYGKIGSPQHRGTGRGGFVSDHWQRIVPACRADDDRNPGGDACQDVHHRGTRLRELDCNVRITERAPCNSLPILVVLGVEHGTDGPPAVPRHLSHCAAHLAVADDRNLGIVHEACTPSLSTGGDDSSPVPKNSRCKRSMAAFTSSPSTITVRLMPVALNDIMCTFVSPSAMRARPIAPPASPIPAPTMAMIPRLLSIDTSPSDRRSTNNASSRAGSSTVTDTETS